MNAEQIMQFLPGVYQRTWRADGPLHAMLQAMAVLHQPVEQSVEAFPNYLNPRQTPEQFLPMLAHWTDLDHLLTLRQNEQGAPMDRLIPTGSGRLRELIATAAMLSQWRGTIRGLIEFLRIATGFQDFLIEEHQDGSGRPRAFHICVHGPPEAERVRPFIENLIRSEKPAHLTFEFVTHSKDASHDNTV